MHFVCFSHSVCISWPLSVHLAHPYICRILSISYHRLYMDLTLSGLIINESRTISWPLYFISSLKKVFWAKISGVNTSGKASRWLQVIIRLWRSYCQGQKSALVLEDCVRRSVDNAGWCGFHALLFMLKDLCACVLLCLFFWPLKIVKYIKVIFFWLLSFRFVSP